MYKGIYKNKYIRSNDFFGGHPGICTAQIYMEMI